MIDEAFELLLARLHVALSEKVQFARGELADLRMETKRVRLALRGLLTEGASGDQPGNAPKAP